MRTPTTALRRAGVIGLALAAGLGALVACTNDQPSSQSVGEFRLVAFDSCADALAGIRTAAKAAVAQVGGRGMAMDGGLVPPAAVPQAAGGEKSNAAGDAVAPAYSGTNNQEVGVDEPDLVKTDGRRIVVVSQGTLRVIDAASRRITGTLSLVDPAQPNDAVRYLPGELLLSGDHALVLLTAGYPYAKGGMEVAPGPPAVEGDAAGADSANSGNGSSSAGQGGGGAPPNPGKPAAADPAPAQPPVAVVPQRPVGGPRLILVDLAGSPHVLSSLAVDGMLVDARQSGSIARVVVRYAPNIPYPELATGDNAQRIRAQQQIIDQLDLDTFLPRIEVRTGSATQRPQIGCDAIVRPSVYSGLNLLTILSLDLAGSALDNPDPVSLLADGETVYSNGSSLYVATDQRWRAVPMVAQGASGRASTPQTAIYRFDTSRPGRPTYVAGGGVPGYLVNQYAMSERDGNLRVATTTGEPWNEVTPPKTQSGVYVLRPDGENLDLVGKVEGLGKGERIYAVRFLDAIAYVVTFHQTDPLYTVDLSDPARPRVRGALKITGYSSYLHPVSDGRLIGVGQEVNSQFRTSGTQISLFDVSNLDDPTRLDRVELAGANSPAESDPHAFLYWPATGLLVVPVQQYQAPDVKGVGPSGPGDGGTGPDGTAGTGVATPSSIAAPYAPVIGALVLRVQGSSLTRVGFLTHPGAWNNGGNAYPIERSLLIDRTLWTVSAGGLMATDTTTLASLAWIPLT